MKRISIIVHSAKLLVALAVLVVFAVASPARADNSRFIFGDSREGNVQLSLNGGATVVQAIQTGWYDQFGNPNPNGVGLHNYIAGICGSSDGCGNNSNFHDYFVFNIPTGVYTSATLQVFNPADGYRSPNPTETYNNWDVTTPISELGTVAGVGIFNDLGSGIQYAGTVVSAADNGVVVNIVLDAAAINAINGDAGLQFAVGGAVVLGGTTPEPSTLLLFGSGITGLIGYLRRRK
jgi:hypothetical protein